MSIPLPYKYFPAKAPYLLILVVPKKQAEMTVLPFYIFILSIFVGFVN